MNRMSATLRSGVMAGAACMVAAMATTPATASGRAAAAPGKVAVDRLQAMSAKISSTLQCTWTCTPASRPIRTVPLTRSTIPDADRRRQGQKARRRRSARAARGNAGASALVAAVLFAVIATICTAVVRHERGTTGDHTGPAHPPAC